MVFPIFGRKIFSIEIREIVAGPTTIQYAAMNSFASGYQRRQPLRKSQRRAGTGRRCEIKLEADWIFMQKRSLDSLSLSLSPWCHSLSLSRRHGVASLSSRLLDTEPRLEFWRWHLIRPIRSRSRTDWNALSRISLATADASWRRPWASIIRHPAFQHFLSPVYPENRDFGRFNIAPEPEHRGSW